MSRTLDATLPTVTKHPIDPSAPMASWPGVLTIAIERAPYDAYVWDDDDASIVWDAAGLVWDAPLAGGGYTDVICDFTSLMIEHGEPDENFLFPAGTAVLSLNDPDGRYSTIDKYGRLIYVAHGRRLAIWWTDTGGATWWLFHGAIASWRQPSAGVVEIEAFCGLAELAQLQGFDWYKSVRDHWPGGTTGAQCANAIGLILNAAVYKGDSTSSWFSRPGYRPSSPVNSGLYMNNDLVLDTHADATTTPLEAAQRCALSDTGVLYTDVDDTLVYTGYYWREGRKDQTGTPPAFTDNHCTAGVLNVWNLELADADDWVATRVVFTNQNNITAIAEKTSGLYQGQRYVFAVSPALYADAVIQNPDFYGDGKRGVGPRQQYLLTTRSNPRLAVQTFTVYLNDPRQNLWMFAIDRRRGDWLRFLHDAQAVNGTAVLDVTVTVVAMRHTILPDSWVAEFATTPALPVTT